MRTITLVLLFAFVCLPAFAVKDNEVLEFKAKIGFSNSEDRIVKHYFFDNGKKLLLIGEKGLQTWDVENAKLLQSIPHQIPQFAHKGSLGDHLLLNIPLLFNWAFYVGDPAIDPNGKWIATVEKIGDNKLKSVIVRDLITAKQIAKLDLPDVSANMVAFDASRNEIITIGQTDKTAAFANWSPATFDLERIIKIDKYKWHQLIRNETKMIVGSGDAKIIWSAANIKEGDSLTLRDVKTGAVEKEFTAKGLNPDSSFRHATIGVDEKYLTAEREKRVFVWDIDGNGLPKFEVSSADPKLPFEFQNVIDGRYIVASRDKNLLMFDIEGDGTPKYEISSMLPKNTVSVAAVSKNGKYFATHQDEKISLFETAGTGTPLYEIARADGKDRFTTVTFSDDDKYLIVSRLNKSASTIFYDLEKGKIAFEITVNMGVGSQPRFIQQGKFLYNEQLGRTLIWNFAENKPFVIPLRTYQQSCPADDSSCTSYGPENTEHTLLSPDEKLILKYGDYDVSVFDIETGKKIQTIFDADTVKYDKQSHVKYSGYGEAGWSMDGKSIFAFDGIGHPRTVSFWTVKK